MAMADIQQRNFTSSVPHSAGRFLQCMPPHKFWTADSDRFPYLSQTLHGFLNKSKKNNKQQTNKKTTNKPACDIHMYPQRKQIWKIPNLVCPSVTSVWKSKSTSQKFNAVFLNTVLSLQETREPANTAVFFFSSTEHWLLPRSFFSFLHGCVRFDLKMSPRKNIFNSISFHTRIFFLQLKCFPVLEHFNKRKGGERKFAVAPPCGCASFLVGYFPVSCIIVAVWWPQVLVQLGIFWVSSANQHFRKRENISDKISHIWACTFSVASSFDTRIPGQLCSQNGQVSFQSATLATAWRSQWFW